MNAAHSARERRCDSTTLLDKRRLSTAFVPAGGEMQAFSHRQNLENNEAKRVARAQAAGGRLAQAVAPVAGMTGGAAK
jgi:hypothetical protein